MFNTPSTKKKFQFPIELNDNKSLNILAVLEKRFPKQICVMDLITDIRVSIDEAIIAKSYYVDDKDPEYKPTYMTELTLGEEKHIAPELGTVILESKLGSAWVKYSRNTGSLCVVKSTLSLDRNFKAMVVVELLSKYQPKAADPATRVYGVLNHPAVKAA